MHKQKVYLETTMFNYYFIAIATVNEMDIILSYNFKHINKLKTKTLVPATNLVSGYKAIFIAQTEEVIDFETDD